MRSGTAIVTILSLGLLISVPAGAEEVQVAKVYRDYPGYINPAVCENPNLEKPAAGESVAKQPETPPAVTAPVPNPPAAAMPPAVQPGQAAPEVQNTPTAMEPAVVMPAAEMQRPCVPAPYWEQSDDPVDVPYLSVWAGVVATNDIDFDPDVDVSFDAGYGFGAALGYDFGPARLEIEASDRNSNTDEVTVDDIEVDGDQDLKIQTLMINGFADFQTGGNLTPYLGAGIGCARVEVDNEDDTVLAGQVAAGVLIAVSPTLAIDLGYRFMMTDDPKLDGAEVEVRQHTVSIGLQFRF